MKTRWYLLIVAIALALALALSTSGTTSSAQASSGRGFSIVSLEPDTADALRAKGKAFKYPFPNSANHGKKFNPQGDMIAPLTTGAQQKVLVLFIDFTDAPPGGPATRLNLGTYFDPMLFGTTYNPPEYSGLGGPTDRTLKNYYKAVSYGNVDVVTLNMPSAMGWAHAANNYAYYSRADGIHDNGFGPYPANAQGLVVEAVKAVDSVVDFRNYAVNGEVPNLFVVHAGTGAEWSGAPDIIWSHSWDLTEGTGMNGYMTNDGVKINNYAMMPEAGGDLTGYSGVVSGPFPPTVGVYAHEYGHVLGLPDQYDYGYESEGTGNFSLMSGGSWNRYPIDRIFSGNSPAELDAWSKYRLGFINPVAITSLANLTLLPAETNSVAYKMVVPNSGGKEYFLFENRQNLGFDAGLLWRHYNAAGALVGDPMHGLAIYHVDDTVLTRNYWRPNEAENWKEFRSEGWQKAPNGETHYGISLFQADDLWNLEHGANRGDTGDLYPGARGIQSFSSCTKPNSSSYYFWAGSDPKYGYSGVTVNNIVESASNISAQFSFVPFNGCKK